MQSSDVDAMEDAIHDPQQGPAQGQCQQMYQKLVATITGPFTVPVSEHKPSGTKYISMESIRKRYPGIVRLEVFGIVIEPKVGFRSLDPTTEDLLLEASGAEEYAAENTKRASNDSEKPNVQGIVVIEGVDMALNHNTNEPMSPSGHKRANDTTGPLDKQEPGERAEIEETDSESVEWVPHYPDMAIHVIQECSSVPSTPPTDAGTYLPFFISHHQQKNEKIEKEHIHKIEQEHQQTHQQMQRIQGDNQKMQKELRQIQQHLDDEDTRKTAPPASMPAPTGPILLDFPDSAWSNFQAITKEIVSTYIEELKNDIFLMLQTVVVSAESDRNIQLRNEMRQMLESLFATYESHSHKLRKHMQATLETIVGSHERNSHQMLKEEIQQMFETLTATLKTHHISLDNSNTNKHSEEPTRKRGRSLEYQSRSSQRRYTRRRSRSGSRKSRGNSRHSSRSERGRPNLGRSRSQSRRKRSSSSHGSNSRNTSRSMKRAETPRNRIRSRGRSMSRDTSPEIKSRRQSRSRSASPVHEARRQRSMSIDNAANAGGKSRGRSRSRGTSPSHRSWSRSRNGSPDIRRHRELTRSKSRSRSVVSVDVIRGSATPVTALDPRDMDMVSDTVVDRSRDNGRRRVRGEDGDDHNPDGFKYANDNTCKGGESGKNALSEEGQSSSPHPSEHPFKNPRQDTSVFPTACSLQGRHDRSRCRSKSGDRSVQSVDPPVSTTVIAYRKYRFAEALMIDFVNGCSLGKVVKQDKRNDESNGNRTDNKNTFELTASIISTEEALAFYKFLPGHGEGYNVGSVSMTMDWEWGQQDLEDLVVVMEESPSITKFHVDCATGAAEGRGKVAGGSGSEMISGTYHFDSLIRLLRLKNLTELHFIATPDLLWNSMSPIPSDMSHLKSLRLQLGAAARKGSGSGSGSSVSNSSMSNSSITHPASDRFQQLIKSATRLRHLILDCPPDHYCKYLELIWGCFDAGKLRRGASLPAQSQKFMSDRRSSTISSSSKLPDARVKGRKPVWMDVQFNYCDRPVLFVKMDRASAQVTEFSLDVEGTGRGVIEWMPILWSKALLPLKTLKALRIKGVQDEIWMSLLLNWLRMSNKGTVLDYGYGNRSSSTSNSSGSAMNEVTSGFYLEELRVDCKDITSRGFKDLCELVRCTKSTLKTLKLTDLYPKPTMTLPTALSHLGTREEGELTPEHGDGARKRVLDSDWNKLFNSMDFTVLTKLHVQNANLGDLDVRALTDLMKRGFPPPVSSFSTAGHEEKQELIRMILLNTEIKAAGMKQLVLTSQANQWNMQIDIRDV